MGKPTKAKQLSKSPTNSNGSSSAATKSPEAAPATLHGDDGAHAMAPENSVSEIAEQEEADLRVGFRQASLEGFFDNRMERDKSLLTLSTLGAGAVLTMWTTRGVGSVPEFLVDVFAVVAFFVTIGMVLSIFAAHAVIPPVRFSTLV